MDLDVLGLEEVVELRGHEALCINGHHQFRSRVMAKPALNKCLDDLIRCLRLPTPGRG